MVRSAVRRRPLGARVGGRGGRRGRREPTGGPLGAARVGGAGGAGPGRGRGGVLRLRRRAGAGGVRIRPRSRGAGLVLPPRGIPRRQRLYFAPRSPAGGRGRVAGGIDASLTTGPRLVEMRAESLLILSLLQATPADSTRPAVTAPRDTLRFYAVGDLNLGRALTYRYLLQGDTLYPFATIADTLRAADVLFGNLESPIAPLGHAFEKTGSFVFSTPPIAADALVRAGFDVVSNANNHAWDVGLTGVFETLKQLDRVVLAHAGTGRTIAEAHRPARLETRGWRIAVFAVTRAFKPAPRHFVSHQGSRSMAWADSGWLYPAIRRLKAAGGVDFVVAS